MRSGIWIVSLLMNFATETTVLLGHYACRQSFLSRFFELNEPWGWSHHSVGKALSLIGKLFLWRNAAQALINSPVLLLHVAPASYLFFVPARSLHSLLFSETFSFPKTLSFLIPVVPVWHVVYKWTAREPSSLTAVIIWLPLVYLCAVWCFWILTHTDTCNNEDYILCSANFSLN